MVCPVKPCAESLERRRLLVYHDYRLATLTEALRQTCPDATTPNNDAFHSQPHSQKEPGRRRAQALARTRLCNLPRALRRTRALRPSSAMSKIGVQAKRNTQFWGQGCCVKETLEHWHVDEQGQQHQFGGNPNPHQRFLPQRIRNTDVDSRCAKRLPICVATTDASVMAVAAR